MTPETAQNILDEVYRNGDRMAILKELDPELRNGYVSVICPSCGQRRAYAYQPGGKTPHVIRCNRQDNCGYQATLVQYAAGTDKPRGKAFINAVRFLAERSGIRIEGETILPPPPIRTPSPDNAGEFIPLDEYFVEKYRKMTMNSQGLTYLAQRGISEDTARELGFRFAPWGQWPHYVTDKKTKKKTPYRQWYPGRLVMPVFDDKNRMISLYGRAVPVDRIPYKHLKHDFLGANKGVFNQTALNQENVHITEGYFDALSIIEHARTHHVEKHACAIFGVYGLRWPMVSAKNICFCFDPDKAGDEWKKLAEEGKKRGKRVFFLDGKTYKDHEDLSALWEHERFIDFTYLEYR